MEITNKPPNPTSASFSNYSTEVDPFSTHKQADPEWQTRLLLMVVHDQDGFYLYSLVSGRRRQTSQQPAAVISISFNPTQSLAVDQVRKKPRQLWLSPTKVDRSLGSLQ
jgi:hypothetical protein